MVQVLNSWVEREDVNGYGMLGVPELLDGFNGAIGISADANEDSTCIVYASFYSDNDDPSPIYIEVYSRNDVSFTLLGEIDTITNADWSSANEMSITNAYQEICFVITADEAVSGRLVIYYQPGIEGNDPSWSPTNNTTYFIIDNPIMDEVPGISGVRVDAMDLLVTYEGSDLNSQGKISGGRVPAPYFPSHALGTDYSIVLDAAAPYNALSNLPFDHYDGRIKKGLHTHWVPGSRKELDLVPPGQYNGNIYKLMAAGNWSVADGQACRVKVTQVIEFTTANVFIGLEFAPPAINFPWVIYVVACKVPAATSNESHVLTKLSAFVRSGVQHVFSYLQKHPEMIGVAIRALAPIMA